MINWLILKSEMNAFTGRVSECFKTGNPRHTTEAGVCEGQGQGLLSLPVTRKEHISCPYGQCNSHLVTSKSCMVLTVATAMLLLTYQLKTVHSFSYRFWDYLKWVALRLSQVSRDGCLCGALGEDSTSFSVCIYFLACDCFLPTLKPTSVIVTLYLL